MKLKSFILVLLVLLIYLTSSAQKTVLPKIKGGATLNGKIIEKGTTRPVEFVTIKLMVKADSTFIAGCISDGSGSFSLSNIPANDYYIEYSSIGFKASKSKPFNVATPKGNLNVGTLEISTQTQVLNEVVITGERKMFNNSIDRKVFNIERDMLSQSGAVTDLLQNIPSVSVSLDGNVSLRGSENVMILINGKTSMLTMMNRADILSQLPANTVDRIEVITNPSAKYKPDGTSGIINIVLKKNTTSGLNGSLAANAGNRSRYNSNLTLNYNPGKLNLFGSFGYRQDDRPRYSDDTRKITSATSVVTYQNIHGEESGRPASQVSNFGMTYDFNKYNQVGASANTFKRTMTKTGFADYKTSNFEHIPSSEYIRNLKSDSPEAELGINAFYLHKFKKEDHEIQFDYEFQHQPEDENNFYNNKYITPPTAQSFDNTLIHNNTSTHLFSIEYKNPIGEEMMLEAGYKGEFGTGNFNYVIESQTNPGSASPTFTTDYSKSNDFRFIQNLNAFYSTFGQTIGKFSYQAGFRIENSQVESRLRTRMIAKDSIVPNNYFSLYPSLHLTEKIGKKGELQFNYSRRVNRPESDDLNPFPEYNDPFNLRAGNPKLKPEYIHSIELGYQFMVGTTTVIPTLFYHNKYNGFTQITILRPDGIFLSTRENLSRNQSAGFELISTFLIHKTISGNFSSNVFYDQIDASNLGYSRRKSNVTWSAKLSASASVTTSTMVQISASYRAPQLTAQGSMSARYGVNIGARQDFLKKKASIIATISDPFNTMTESSTFDTPFLTKTTVRKRDARVVSFGFVYHFGASKKLKEEALQFDNAI
jgi:outer membrane receptor protein involved in Fe transport